MLERAVWIPKSRSDRADSGPHSVAHHFAQPAGIARVDVVVQEREHVSFRGRGAAIDQAAEVELPCHARHAGRFFLEGVQELSVAASFEPLSTITISSGR